MSSDALIDDIESIFDWFKTAFPGSVCDGAKVSYSWNPSCETPRDRNNDGNITVFYDDVYKTYVLTISCKLPGSNGAKGVYHPGSWDVIREELEKILNA